MPFHAGPKPGRPKVSSSSTMILSIKATTLLWWPLKHFVFVFVFVSRRKSKWKRNPLKSVENKMKRENSWKVRASDKSERTFLVAGVVGRGYLKEKGGVWLKTHCVQPLQRSGLPQIARIASRGIRRQKCAESCSNRRWLGSGVRSCCPRSCARRLGMVMWSGARLVRCVAWKECGHLQCPRMRTGYWNTVQAWTEGSTVSYAARYRPYAGMNGFPIECSWKIAVWEPQAGPKVPWCPANNKTLFKWMRKLIYLHPLPFGWGSWFSHVCSADTWETAISWPNDGHRKSSLENSTCGRPLLHQRRWIAVSSLRPVINNNQ